MPKRLTVDQLPHLLVSAVVVGDGRHLVTGTISGPLHLLSDLEVDEQICLWLAPKTVVVAVIRHAAPFEDQSKGTLVTLDWSTPEVLPRVGELVPAFHRFNDYMVPLVLDRTRCWSKVRFQALPAFETRDENGRQWRIAQPGDESRTDGKVVRGMWDHEHCTFCFARIEEGDGSSDAFVDTGNNWVCPKCFHAYVEPEDLAFLQPRKS